MKNGAKWRRAEDLKGQKKKKVKRGKKEGRTGGDGLMTGSTGRGKQAAGKWKATGKGGSET